MLAPGRRVRRRPRAALRSVSALDSRQRASRRGLRSLNSQFLILGLVSFSSPYADDMASGRSATRGCTVRPRYSVPPASFVQTTLWPEFDELSGALHAHLHEITAKMARNA